MRIFAKLGALAALASLSAAQTRPFAHVESTCSPQATETVFVTVFPAESSIVSAVSFDTHGLPTATSLPEPGPAGITITTYEQSAPSVTRTSSVGPAVSSGGPAPVVSEASSIVTIETFTVAEGPSGLPFTGTLTITRLCPGAVDCTGLAPPEPTDPSTAASAQIEAASTFILTTTITSGVSPQVVETSTYTVIETLSSEVSPVASSTSISVPTSASIPETSRSLSTASFTLTLGTVTVPSSVVSGSPTSSSSPILVIPYASATPSLPAASASGGVSLTVLTVTLPGLPGATPTVLTITATEELPGAPTTPLLTPVSVVTMTTTVSSGGIEVSLNPPAPTVSDVVMTYTVLGPDGLALTTMTMTTLYSYTPPAGVGTSYVPVSTVTAVNTVTVEGTLPLSLPPFPNITTPFVTTITPPPSPGYTFTPPPENITTSVPLGNATGAPIESPPAITPSATTIFVNGSPVATSLIVPVNSTSLVAPVPGSPTEVPPTATELPPSLTALPPFPTTNGTVTPPAASGSETEVPPSPTNSTSSITASVIVPLNSTTLALPLPTNGTSPGNVTASPTRGQGGASPTPPANGTAPGSPPANQTTSGNVGPTPSVNGTTPAPSSNQTATGGQSAPSQGGQGGHGGQGAPTGSPSANVTSPAPTANQTASVGPTQSSPGQSSPSQGGQGGQGAPSQGGPSKSQGAPSQGGQGGQGAPSQTASSQGGQGGQGQSQSAPAQTPPPQSQGGQGQSQGSQSRSQGGQSQGGQSQGGQGQSQGPVQSRSQGQGQSIGAGQPQGNADPLNTALGLPSPTGVPGASLSTLTTIITLSAPGVKARAVTTSPTATAACGNAADQSEVVFDFDDLPTLHVQMAPGSSVHDALPIPMYSPYHRFSWSEGFRVFPTSVCPYKSSSGKLMVEYSPSTKNYEAAEIGVGALSTNPCFRFDFTSLRVGCASTRASCKFNVTGLAWDSDSQVMVVVASHAFSTRACSAQKGCKLGSITADASYGLTNLTSVLIDVTANGQTQTWWADDLTVAWTDDSCASAVCRSGVRDFVPRRGRRHGENHVPYTLP